MPVRFHVPEMLRRYAGGAGEVHVAGATVRAALGVVFARHPDLRVRVLGPDERVHPYFALFRNDRELPRASALDATLDDGDVLALVGAAEGG